MPHHYETWVYSLHGSRKQLYTGKSEEAARKTRNIAIEMIHEFRLDASIIVAGCGYMHGFETVDQTDYYNGWPEPTQPKRKLRLALDKK